MEGIDVSKWQGTVDWAKVAGAGKVFAIARSSIASFTTDETFVRNYKGMVSAGLVPGAYHLVSGQSTGAAQATNFKSQLDAAGFDKGLLVLDVEGWSETTGFEAGTLAATEYLCNWIRNTYKRDPIIYTGVYWRESLKQHPKNFGSQLWLSYYGTRDPQGYVPTAWDSYRIWQYTQLGTCPGITGDVDLNRATGTLRNLKSLAGWGWDELATQAEIRAVVADEVNKAIAALTATNNTNKDTVLTTVNANRDSVLGALAANKDAVVTALRDVEVRLAADIASNRHAETMSRDELLTKFSEVLSALSVNDDVESFSSLTELINNLHTHVCHRVDLHT